MGIRTAIRDPTSLEMQSNEFGDAVLNILRR